MVFFIESWPCLGSFIVPVEELGVGLAECDVLADIEVCVFVLLDGLVDLEALLYAGLIEHSKCSVYFR